MVVVADIRRQRGCRGGNMGFRPGQRRHSARAEPRSRIDPRFQHDAVNARRVAAVEQLLSLVVRIAIARGLIHHELPILQHRLGVFIIVRVRVEVPVKVVVRVHLVVNALQHAVIQRVFHVHLDFDARLARHVGNRNDGAAGAVRRPAAVGIKGENPLFAVRHHPRLVGGVFGLRREGHGIKRRIIRQIQRELITAKVVVHVDTV